MMSSDGKLGRVTSQSSDISVCGKCSESLDYRRSYTDTLLSILHEGIPRAVKKSAVRRPVKISQGMIVSRVVEDCTYDTGASNGNYITSTTLKLLGNYEELDFMPCRHTAVLGDGELTVSSNKTVVLTVYSIDDYDQELEGVDVEFYVIESRSDQVIIGLPDIVGVFYDYFAELLAKAAGRPLQRRSGAEVIMQNLDALCSDIEDELGRKEPRYKRIAAMVCKARRELVKYKVVKDKVVKDPAKVRGIMRRSEDDEGIAMWSTDYADVFEDDSMLSQLVEAMETKPMELKNHSYGEMLQPWKEIDPPCVEETETPDPLFFGEDVLRFMETSIEDSVQEYHSDLPKHFSQGCLTECSKMLQFLHREEVADRFAPKEWKGLKVPEINFELKMPLPDRLSPASRPIRSDLYEHAKKEFDRLRTYFFVESASSVASPLVIAPKATTPYIRFCGDYREVNKYLKIPQEPIPIPHLEIIKAAKYRVYIDLDMANSFHQIPISK